MVPFGLGFLIVPLGAWALLARTRLIGWTIAAALLGCDVGWLMVLTGHINSDSRPGLTMLLVVLTPLLLVAGLLAERKFCVRPPRDTGVRMAGRILLGASIAANVFLAYGTLLSMGNLTPS